MTMTVLYRLGGSNPGEIGEIRNSWSSGMYVWNDIAKQYFKLVSFPMFDQKLQNTVWNADSHVIMPKHEVLVLRSTMDKAVIKGSNVHHLVAAFEQYAKDHPNSSFGKQAEILKNSDIQPDEFVGWNQTSVVRFWGVSYDEDEIAVYYDPNVSTDHFEIYGSVL